MSFKFKLHRPKFIFLSLAGLLLTLLIAYIGLSVYKAISYTANPAQLIISRTPAQDGLLYEEVTFSSAANDALKLRGWWLPNPQSSRVLILVHGRGGNRASYASLFPTLVENGYNVLTFDLRGHGQSDPAYTTWGLNEQWDIVGAVNFAKSKGFKPASIGVIGWSVGAASALMAMSQTSDIKAVVSDSAYANAGPLLAHNVLYPGLVVALRLVRGIDINLIQPEQAITKIGSRHVFLIHGAQDNQVPLEQARLLQQAASVNITDSWIVPEAGHVEAIVKQPAEYMRRVLAFFNIELAQ